MKLTINASGREDDAIPAGEDFLHEDGAAEGFGEVMPSDSGGGAQEGDAASLVSEG